MENVIEMPVKSEKVSKYEAARIELGECVGDLNSSTFLQFRTYVEKVEDVEDIRKFVDQKDALIMRVSVLADEVEQMVKDGAHQEFVKWQIDTMKYWDAKGRG